jgi:hypothetical protein
MSIEPKNPRQQGLECDIIAGRLVISIGVEALRQAVILGPYLVNFTNPAELSINDVDIFARDVLLELEWEEEDGLTLIHHAIDKAAERAIENGSEGVACDE